MRRSGRNEQRENSEDCGYTSADEVITLLAGIESHRLAISEATDKFERWLLRSGELRETWNRFLASGGVSADEFRQFLEGRFRHRRVRQRQHLRLISSRKQGISRVRRQI